MDRLTKCAHFIPIRIDYPLSIMATLCRDQIVWLHRVLLGIISDKDPRFTSHFWKDFQAAVGTKSMFSSTTFNHQTVGQHVITIQILDDLLRACVLDFGGGAFAFGGICI